MSDNKKALEDIREKLLEMQDLSIRGDVNYGSLDEEFTVLEMAEKWEKYRWHDLRENPDDLPDIRNQVEVYGINYHYCHAQYGEFRDSDDRYRNCWVRYDAWSGNEELKDVLAWREIEPYEPEEDKE